MITSGSVSGKVNIDGPQGNYNVVHLSLQEIFLLRSLVLKGEWIFTTIKNPMKLDLFNKFKNKVRIFCSGLSEAILVVMELSQLFGRNSTSKLMVVMLQPFSMFKVNLIKYG